MQCSEHGPKLNAVFRVVTKAVVERYNDRGTTTTMDLSKFIAGYADVYVQSYTHAGLILAILLRVRCSRSFYIMKASTDDITYTSQNRLNRPLTSFIFSRYGFVQYEFS